MVYLIASILIHGILFTCGGLTFIPRAQYSVQPSDQTVEVSIEEISYPVKTLQNGDRSIKSSTKIEKPEKITHPVAGVKVKANPGYSKNSPPEYPELARQMRQEGLVLLSVDVDRQGGPLRIEIIKSSGYRLLDQAAVMSVKHWKFQPGRIGDVSIESEVTVPIRFRLEK